MPSLSELDVPTLVLDQLTWHWTNQLRPRLKGMSDSAYHWEPASCAWGVRPRGTSPWPMAVGSGEWTIDFAYPEPKPAPVTTIAWRLGHVLVGVLGARLHAHFEGPPVDYSSYDYPGVAAEALERLDTQYEAWVSGIQAMGADGLARRCGPAEGPYADEPLLTLVLHIHRELIHHGAEIALLSDLYAARH